MPRGVYEKTPEHKDAISRSMKGRSLTPEHKAAIGRAMRVYYAQNPHPKGGWRQRGWSHGTASGYNNHKCRCDECRSAWTAYLGERRRAQREIAKELATW